MCKFYKKYILITTNLLYRRRRVTMDYNKAVKFIEEKHKGQKRIGGDDYFTHPIAVANLLKKKPYLMKWLLRPCFTIY